MSMCGQFPSGGGYYGKDGKWIRLKFCFVACPPNRCNCMPPNGQFYSKAHDETKLKSSKEN